MCWSQPAGSGAETGISSFGSPQHCCCKLIPHIYKRKQARLLNCFTLYSSNRPTSASFKGFLSPLSPNPLPSASPKQSGALLLPSRSPEGLPLFPRKIIIKMIIKIATKGARPGRGQVQPRRALGGAAGAAMGPGRGRGRGMEGGRPAPGAGRWEPGCAPAPGACPRLPAGYFGRARRDEVAEASCARKSCRCLPAVSCSLRNGREAHSAW